MRYFQIKVFKYIFFAVRIFERYIFEFHIAYQLFTVRGKMPELDLVNEVLYHNAVLKIAGGESVSY